MFVTRRSEGCFNENPGYEVKFYHVIKESTSYVTENTNDIVLKDVMYIITTSGTSGHQPKVVYVTKSCVEPNISDFM